MESLSLQSEPLLGEVHQLSLLRRYVTSCGVSLLRQNSHETHFPRMILLLDLSPWTAIRNIRLTPKYDRVVIGMVTTARGRLS